MPKRLISAFILSKEYALTFSDTGRKKDNYGYNAKTKTYCDLQESGVLDSAKVLRVALENSVSTASMILLIDCVIYEEPKEDEDKK